MRCTLRRLLWVTLVLGCLVGVVDPARAEVVRVASAANFTATLRKLVATFEAGSGHRVLPSSASTGQLYAQIRAGAPFDVFLSADRARPLQLEADGLCVEGSRFIYARGQLAVWSEDAGLVDARTGIAQIPARAIVAMADPRTAPYGAVARDFLQRRGWWKPLESSSRIALATSVTQTHQFVASGAAQIGFVALSQVIHAATPGSYWVVPAGDELDQEAVLLRHAAKNPAALAWLEFLKHDERARALIRADGYVVP